MRRLRVRDFRAFRNLSDTLSIRNDFVHPESIAVRSHSGRATCLVVRPGTAAACPSHHCSAHAGSALLNAPFMSTLGQ